MMGNSTKLYEQYQQSYLTFLHKKHNHIFQKPKGLFVLLEERRKGGFLPSSTVCFVEKESLFLQLSSDVAADEAGERGRGVFFPFP